ncbi:carbohydrate kinase [Macrococcoides canis]|uniref:Winged helix-turn-helix transcriptional regulator n=1 Tax=Macrococcoides canis TaxID=1855823 RepID=A0AAE6WZZ5_9STAP|nr:carbohydrate kinase [Macrococcus canis]QCT74170.1 winged helix-turn-helix transcriptional regulator [Macrococcus canis]QIH77619.1 winged helix-turn-helix transcriptional regulator [Macrococcus canis]QTQ08620.1 winged helix-turn-helix transcriptional regulator [Macrococcus canis]
MNKNEQEILERIRENPFISQQELSELIGLSRPAVANIISGLIKKEYVQGKAYVLNDNYPIVCIGAANVDRKFHVDGNLILETSNPVTSTKSVGGVARNIAENLGRLGEDVAFFTTCGNDSEWEMIRQLSSPFMNLDYVQQIEGASTGSYTALIDASGDMQYGLADMSVYDLITPELLIKKTHLLNKAKCIVVDLNISRPSLEFICAYSEKHNIKLAFITVSTPKMKNMPESLHAVDWLITNRDETATFFNKKIDTLEDLKDAAQLWIDKGIRHVVVTNGVKDYVYADKDGIKTFKVSPSHHVVDVTGAGDSFSAAIIYSWLHNYEIEEIILSGAANSKKTIETAYTVRQNLDKKQLIKDMEELKNETIS